MRNDKYWPRQFEELADDPTPVTLVNEPLPPDNVIALPKARSLHAVLCEALIGMQALHARLEAGVHVPEAWQREVVRALYVATKSG
jgi:hypothetical protein